MIASVILIEKRENDYIYCRDFVRNFGNSIFALATITMKNNWRVEISDEKTLLLNIGIYKWSRNPAFIGFDLLYVSISLMFFKVPLLIVSGLFMIMFHFQIL